MVKEEFRLVNERLAKKEFYTKDSWKTVPVLRFVLEKTEEILLSLEVSITLPASEKDELAFWLLNRSPLTEEERQTVRKFLFEIDFY